MPGPSPTADSPGDGAAITTLPDEAAAAPSPELVGEVLDVVRSMLIDLIGPELLADLSIGLGTAFDADLEMDSIEFVALTESLQEHYGDDLDFIAWLSGLDFEEIVELTVGDLVTFTVSSVA